MAWQRMDRGLVTSRIWSVLSKSSRHVTYSLFSTVFVSLEGLVRLLHHHVHGKFSDFSLVSLKVLAHFDRIRRGTGSNESQRYVFLIWSPAQKAKAGRLYHHRHFGTAHVQYDHRLQRKC